GWFRYPEHALSAVFIRIVQELVHLRLVDPVGEHLGTDLLPALGERVRHVLEEHQPEHELLVLRGVHRAPQLVRGLPQGVPQLGHGGYAGQGVLPEAGLPSRRHAAPYRLDGGGVVPAKVNLPCTSPVVAIRHSSSTVSISRRARSLRASAAASSSSNRATSADGSFGNCTSSRRAGGRTAPARSEEHTSELQSRENLVCRLLLEKKKN